MDISAAVMSNNDCLTAKDCKFIWRISNYSIRCKGVGERILSPFFTAGDFVSDKIKMRLRIYPFGNKNENKDFISLFLECALSNDIDSCDVSYRLDLWNNNNPILNETEKAVRKYLKRRKSLSPMNLAPHNDSEEEQEKTERKRFKNFNENECRWGNPTFLSRNGEEIKKHLLLSRNDTLSIICCLYNITPHYKNRLMHSVELIRGFDLLFLSENFSDVTIEVDKKKLKAHKVILSTRSEFFSAMFVHNTVESNECVINITDISYEVMKEVLRFIYCGKVENLDLHKKDLLIAADKYNLGLLKDSCEESFCQSLSISNVCEILIMADLHNCNKLKTASLNILIKNIKEVVDRPELIQLAHTNPNLSLDIFRLLAKK